MEQHDTLTARMIRPFARSHPLQASKLTGILLGFIVATAGELGMSPPVD